MARRKTDSRKQATREAALPSAACSALEKIRRQIGRLETHARIKYPGDPTPEQCTIMARELTDAADTLENEVRQLWKLRCEVGNCPWVVSQNDERIRGDADARKQTGSLSPSDDAACSENQPEPPQEHE